MMFPHCGEQEPLKVEIYVNKENTGINCCAKAQSLKKKKFYFLDKFPSVFYRIQQIMIYMRCDTPPSIESVEYERNAAAELS